MPSSLLQYYNRANCFFTVFSDRHCVLFLFCSCLLVTAPGFFNSNVQIKYECLALRPQVASAGVHAFVRFGSAAFVSEKLAEFRKRPEQPIILYGALKQVCHAVHC